MSPIAIPATGALMGMPASIMDSEPPHTEAIEEEPFDSRISETILMVYGKSSLLGRMGIKERSASIPCPISLRPGPEINFTSPVQNAGKL